MSQSIPDMIFGALTSSPNPDEQIDALNKLTHPLDAAMKRGAYMASQLDYFSPIGQNNGENHD